MNDREIIIEYLKAGESDEKRIGLELEHFILNDAGESIGFPILSELIRTTGEELRAELNRTDGHVIGYDAGDHTVSIEPACQFEISIAPFGSLEKIEEIYQSFRQVWDPRFAALGFKLIMKGINPSVESGRIRPEELPMIPKDRYIYMDRYFLGTGSYGAHMMRASASTQISLDYASEKDMVKKLMLLTILSPVFMQIMENKSLPDSRLAEGKGKHLIRTQIWEDLDPDRTGFFPEVQRGEFGYGAYADMLLSRPLILLTDEGKTVYVERKALPEVLSLSELSGSPIRQTKVVEHLLSMFFHHIRLKKYLEVRVADSVPIRKALGYAALMKGLFYDEGNLSVLEKWFSECLISPEEAILRTEFRGEDAVIYSGKKVRVWKEKLLELAEGGLPKQEMHYLNELRV